MNSDPFSLCDCGGTHRGCLECGYPNFHEDDYPCSDSEPEWSEEEEYRHEQAADDALEELREMEREEQLAASFHFVSDKCKDQEMCDRAVAILPGNLRFVPNEFKTQEMCERAVAGDGSVFQCVPNEFKTREMCERAVDAQPYNFDYVPERFRTYSMCCKAGFWDWTEGLLQSLRKKNGMYEVAHYYDEERRAYRKLLQELTCTSRVVA